MIDNPNILPQRRFASLSDTKNEHLHFLENYFESKKNIPSFPFVIFCDHAPGRQELEDVLNHWDIYEKKVKPYVLILNKRLINDLANHLDLLAMGIDDIIEWTDEKEIICYLEAKYTRDNIIKEALESPEVKDNLIGDSPVWKSFLYEIVETTLFSNASILLIGESGTGKELISRLIHTLDKRIDKRKFVVVDCTTIVPGLSGSELFGHERGSYTNAIQSREGAVALANGGTLFLDEIGELPVSLQPELLRVLQEGTYKKVGSNSWQKTSFRLVCATNRNLQSLVDEGKFRQDLFFRISDCQFHVPSLDERRDDIPLLVKYFLSKFFNQGDCPDPDRPVLEYLVNRKYPGNVRQLKQLVQRLSLKHIAHKKITIGEVPPDDRSALCRNIHPAEKSDIDSFIRKALLTGENWWNLKNKISETAIQVALELENNNKQKAAERLGVDVRTVQQYVKKKTMTT
ncbi:sigma-54-dependent transcriptional regulator [Mucilaginibacter aquaedulcis]|uniref:sigma-54-dependent transcriptional regulator n=1 Tax=Mucilaginibacter aquaedulcis TaxID=1187081 RepID=UPI0025B5A9E1|nr:sigma 54-interacting transcriptional regulator [Mucilaginibacter aquaedulcis]MDN3548638.1 sigma 54-interacting transcriptional regulator [Mucilaginibacter aquaedulcis]